jgi:hypothetical protein
VLALVAAYLLWIVTMVVTFVVCVAWQSALLQLYLVLGWNKYGRSAFTYAAIILLITIWLVLVVAVEHWYRSGAERGTLLKRAAWTLGILAALLGTALAIGRIG